MKHEEIVLEEIWISGTVQGVGFRPTVYRLAQTLGLSGEVCNNGEGVLILAMGRLAILDIFAERIQQECPPLARIEAIARRPYNGDRQFKGFQVVPSIHSRVRTEIAADAATCPACHAEIVDPLSRWYRYPFTNCTHCGPRLSIIRSIPYDRGNTSMAEFPMCPDCGKEYDDVTNRRFHAQPIACPACGPQVWLEGSDGQAIAMAPFSRLDEVDAVCTLLQRGEIVAIKGIGGFHLACDATHEIAVQTLRQRKHRYHKPFALMARNLGIIEQYCIISEPEQRLLQSPAAPIVLLRQKPDVAVSPLAPSLAPGYTTLGFMLPYSPLHHLVLQRMDTPIVLTSGNLSDEPQCIDNQDAREKLSGIADYFLVHNRAIANRVDDSVVRVIDAMPQVWRRSRGYAPAPIRLPHGFEQAPPLLAMGSELKNTFCLVQDGKAILSQHLGDLENAAAFAAYQQTIDRYLTLFEHQPGAIAVDLHPEYLSSKWGQELAAHQGKSLPLMPIQHHHAHVAACLADHHIPLAAPPVLGIALDGSGYGDDGTLWGGEFLLADYCSYQRLGRFKPVAMIGGEQAVYHPWRNTYAHLKAAIPWDEVQHHYGHLELVKFLAQQPCSLFDQVMQKGINSPLASSCGRLFDAVASALGVCRDCSYEGQAAIALERLAEPLLTSLDSRQDALQQAYPFTITLAPLPTLEPRLMWQSLLKDLQQEVPNPVIAARFHLGLAIAITEMVHHLHHQHPPFTQVALTGGAFQNQLLTRYVRHFLTQMGFTVLIHRQVPCNDGGLALGQAAIAAAQLIA